jgi:zinc/manganese transport system ATP-binding protein
MNANYSNIITVENLAAGYQNKIVWQDANFTIDHGEFVAIIGPNGSGKTTLFRLLLGLQRPIRGNIKIFNAPPKRGNPHIGFVPQRHLIDPEMNIESLELVRLGFSGKWWGFNPFSKKDRKYAFDALKAVGAEDLAHRSLGVLSGGELQRVFLAEALVSNPDLLLLDEPLSNLDIKREQELVQLIAHNINPLLPVLDKVVYIVNGKVAIGKPNEVLTSESLSTLYGTQVEVLRGSQGQVAVIGIEENQHHYD